MFLDTFQSILFLSRVLQKWRYIYRNSHPEVPKEASWVIADIWIPKPSAHILLLPSCSDKPWQRGNVLGTSQSPRRWLGRRAEENLSVHLCCWSMQRSSSDSDLETFIGHERGGNSFKDRLCSPSLLLASTISQAFLSTQWVPSLQGVLHREGHGTQLSNNVASRLHAKYHFKKVLEIQHRTRKTEELVLCKQT